TLLRARLGRAIAGHCSSSHHHSSASRGRLKTAFEPRDGTGNSRTTMTSTRHPSVLARNATLITLVFTLASCLTCLDICPAHAQGGFTSQLIDPTNTQWHGFWTSIAFDPSGAAHVAYSEQGLTTSNYVLTYATNASGTWTTTLISATGENVVYPTIAVGLNALPIIAYYDGGVGHLMAITKTSGGWQAPETVDSYFRSGSFPHMSINQNGVIYISYFRDL